MTRTEIINKLALIYGAETYLEIGVYDGKNFKAVNVRKKVGVDPDLKTPATVHTDSDNFFARNKAKFDLIFIDGLHHCDQVIRDIDNSLACLNDNGTIVVHDCNPTSYEMQAVPRIQGEWTGDVWRAWVHFRHTRPDLSMTVLDTDYGVGVIRMGKQCILEDVPKTYEEFVKDKGYYLNLFDIEYKPTLQIAVPTFDQYGVGVKHFQYLLESIRAQKNYRLTVSDNSPHDLIKECVKSSEYYKSERHGISANTNHSLRFIWPYKKIMYQDDAFNRPDAIELISFALLFDNWVACAGVAIDANNKPYRNYVPKWPENPFDIFYKNTIGMPSVIAFFSINQIQFDENLKTLLDCDFYYQLFLEFGKPGIIKLPLIQQRYHDNSTSRKQGNLSDQELPYIKAKYGHN